MNINDVSEEITIPEDIWTAIFTKQNELAQKYKDIEQMGDLLDTVSNNINTAKGQKWLKDFAWRVTEELAEAYEAEDKDSEHFKEELIDALHFLVELTIIAGYDTYRVPKVIIASEVTPWEIVYEMGLMCNCLKNKPWKQSQMLTDRPKFFYHLNRSWVNMYQLLRQEIGEDKDIYVYYFKKNKVNQFRQRSKY